MNAELLMLIGGLSAFLLTISWVRSRDLSEKYAVLWLLVAAMLLCLGLFPGAFMLLAGKAKLAYPSAVLFVSLAFIYVFAFSVSVSLSRQHRQNNRLMQEIALLEQRVRQVESERRVAGDAAGTTAPRPGA